MNPIDLQLDPMPVVLKRQGTSRSVFLRDVKAQRFTPPVKIGRCCRWPRHESDAIIAARINGVSDEQLRNLVAELIAQRAALMPASLRR